MSLPHPEPLSGASYSAVELMPDDASVVMLDQRLQPSEEIYVTLTSAAAVAQAITDMVVRGAPAIGISAAYGMVLAARQNPSELSAAAERLERARPTAVNLRWAVRRMLEVGRLAGREGAADALAVEARRIHREDVEACRAMGRFGAEHVPDSATVLTHCNAGALATGGYGTALGVIRAAHEQGKSIRVFADETRPYLQGARLTAWELHREGIDVRVIADHAAASLFAKGAIDLAVVGSDRIARNGDVANKIGTYGVACVAHHHERPLYVAAPWSTVDIDCPDGAHIPIEQRDGTEISHFGERRLTPEGVGIENPAFDVTPARLVRAIFTERGTISPVTEAAVLELSGAASGDAP